ncbi:MAG: hypothetical protein MI919_31695, partial [Holophagales bacterium]|nr:hypothetical protein [Holophagales bacterium]
GLGLTFAYNNTAGWVFNLGYFDPGDSDFLDVSDEVRVGVGYAHGINEKTEWITELSGIVYTDSNGEHDAADIASGARWRLSNPEWAVNAALRVDLSDTSFDYSPVGGLVGLSYSPKNKFGLEITKEGSGTGTVRGEKIDCGSQCSAKYHCGTTVNLEATPDPGSRFDGWAGDCAGDSPSTSITLDVDKSCSAKFVKIYDLTVQLASKKHADGDQPGKGKVAITSPAGAPDCSNGCKVTYDVGTKVDLKATPLDTSDGPSTFGGWSVDCSGSGDGTSVEMSSDKTCVATFVGPPRPCEPKLEKIESVKCAVYSKKSEWSCDAATWTQLIEGFAADSADIPSSYLPNDGNEKKTALCDVVNFLRICPQVKACIAGSEAAGEAHCTAEDRSARVASFFWAQSEYPAFENLDGRYTHDAACADQPDPGRSAEIFFEK